MKYDQIQKLSDEKFRRLTGVQHPTFLKMLEILEDAEKNKRRKGGRRPKLCLANQLLLTLEYLREYRTYFHIAQDYGVSESSAYKTVRWVEDTLIKHPTFSLPGRKELLKSDVQYDVILIDASETPIERPKKNKSTFTQARRKDTP